MSFENQPGRKVNYELQQALLAEMQRGIHDTLFSAGVIERVVATVPPQGASHDLKGINMLDGQYTPELKWRRDGEHEERVLKLRAQIPDPKTNGESTVSFTVAGVDDYETVFPRPGVDAEDAAGVWAAAQDLLIAQQEGLLPGLAPSLTHIVNPNTSFTSTRPRS